MSKTFNLTPLRLRALRWIRDHPGVYVSSVAENILARKRHLWPQAATRMGAGYCKPLAAQGLICIKTFMQAHYGTCTITDAGLAAIAADDAKNNPATMSLDAVLERCEKESQ